MAVLPGWGLIAGTWQWEGVFPAMKGTVCRLHGVPACLQMIQGSLRAVHASHIAAQVHQSGSGWSPVYVEDNLAVMSIGAPAAPPIKVPL